ncbi:MAG: ribokinase [Paracoccus sp. (in: a-proteobacteria)]|nr:ribokinase [Paracoccus sp. (in: a-proteobacteria)]
MAIWNLGSINIDHVYHLDALPRPGETIAARSYTKGLGGKGANQSIAAARAGANTLHLGAMGRQDDWLCDRLVAAGIDLTHVARLDHEATGHAIILLDAMAENEIVIHPGANRAIAEDHLAAALNGMTARDTLLLQNETNGQRAAARIARGRDARVIYSAAPFDCAAVAKVLPHVTILAMNEGEAAELSRAMASPPSVSGMLVTLGAKGAEYRDFQRNEVHRQPAFPVVAVDTTGAGDTFVGYFAAALDEGSPIAAALRLAAAAAALQVTRHGAADAIPTRAEVETFLVNQPI